MINFMKWLVAVVLVMIWFLTGFFTVLFLAVYHGWWWGAIVGLPWGISIGYLSAVLEVWWTRNATRHT